MRVGIFNMLHALCVCCGDVCVSVVRDGPLIEQLSLLAKCVYQPDGEHRGRWH